MAYQNPTNQNAADKSRQRGQIQRDIIMLESDKKKKAAQKMQLDAEIRECKKAQQRADMEFQEKQLQLKKIEQEIATLDVSIKGIQKKQNAI